VQATQKTEWAYLQRASPSYAMKLRAQQRFDFSIFRLAGAGC
jgi:hypothetical protein